MTCGGKRGGCSAGVLRQGRDLRVPSGHSLAARLSVSLPVCASHTHLRPAAAAAVQKRRAPTARFAPHLLLQPKRGSLAGGTTITIEGNDLMVSVRQVFFAVGRVSQRHRAVPCLCVCCPPPSGEHEHEQSKLRGWMCARVRACEWPLQSTDSQSRRGWGVHRATTRQASTSTPGRFPATSCGTRATTTRCTAGRTRSTRSPARRSLFTATGSSPRAPAARTASSSST